MSCCADFQTSSAVSTPVPTPAPFVVPTTADAALKMLDELRNESLRFPRQVTCDSEIPGDLLAHLKRSPEKARAAFSTYCKQVKSSYERWYDCFQELIGDAPARELVGPFRELVKLYRAVVDAYGLLEYGVARGWLDAKNGHQRELFVRESPATVLHACRGVSRISTETSFRYLENS